VCRWRRGSAPLRFATHGKELVRDIVELAVGTTYGPTTRVRLIAATLDPRHLKPESTWYLATSLPLAEVSAEPVDEISRFRDGIEHDYQPAKHELGWAASQMRPERAMVRQCAPLAAGAAGLHLESRGRCGARTAGVSA
jgi:hypothetical protein